MADKIEGTPAKEEKIKAHQAVLFELENIAVRGRKIAFDVIKSVLADHNVELTPPMYSRYCLQSTPNRYLKKLLSDGKNAHDKIAEEIQQGIKLSLTDGGLKINKDLQALLDNKDIQRAAIGAISVSGEETARQMMEKLGLLEKNVACLASEGGEDYPRADQWLKLSRRVQVDPSCCVALASSAASCHSALSAGMLCVVVPDDFTGFQDFGGADLVTDRLDQDTVTQILELLDT
jgi:beta-phosphoglucomutase-like phosphatase (HAD superfamily)